MSEPKLELVEYVRTSSGRPRGCLLAITDSLESPVFSIGFSLCHPDDVFLKKEAKRIARARAQKWKEKVLGEESKHFIVDVPGSLRSPLQKFLRRCKPYFKEKMCVISYIEGGGEELGSSWSVYTDGGDYIVSYF